jgi:hypothetical protein
MGGSGAKSHLGRVVMEVEHRGLLVDLLEIAFLLVKEMSLERRRRNVTVSRYAWL